MESIKDIVHSDFVNLRENKSEYFGKFYDNNYKLVYRICFSILKNTENSEDLAQTVFEKILKMKEDKYPTEYESSWLYTVTKNECLQFIRKTKVNQNQDELENVEGNSNEIENIIDNDCYDKIIKKLDKKQEQIVSLRVVSEFTFKEIGQIMSMPIATVQWYYYTSIRSLKAAMANLAMFLIALVVGIRYFQKDEAESKSKEVKSKSKDVHESTIEQKESDEGSVVIQDNYYNKNHDISSIIDYTETTSAELESADSKVDYKGVGIISICGIFLMFTIIFSIIFIKYQQKGNKKTSKK